MSTPVASQVANHCPFGCCAADLDENGYCHHLIGWTSNGTTYEKMVRGQRGLRKIECNQFDAGTGTYKRVVHKIPAEAQLVNPITPQLVDTIWHQAKKWVSDRVYCRNVPEQKAREEIIATEEVIEDEADELAIA